MPYILLIAAAIGLVLYGYFDNSKAQRLGEHLIFWSIGAFLFACAPYTVHWLAAAH